MKFIAFLIILNYFYQIFASTYYTGNFSNPEYPGKCYISPDLIVSPGATPHPLYKCQTIDCRSDGTADIFTSHPDGCLDVMDNN